jgi:hypothetical protein
MSGLTMHRLVFTLETHDQVEFAVQVGSQLRGALYNSLRHQYCSAPNGKHDPTQAEFCPVCWLMAREDSDSGRGKDVPRAFTLIPPMELKYKVGETFRFSVNMFGRAIGLFPYLVLALPMMGNEGVGQSRGRFTLRHIDAYHPLSGEYLRLYTMGTTVRRHPQFTIDQEAVKSHAQGFHADKVRMRFLTPMRLIRDGKLCKKPDFSVLIARLLERFDLLQHEYGNPALVSPYQELTPLAAGIKLVEDQTQWVEVWSGSRRQNTSTPISGFVGEAVFQGDLAPFWTWLLWGSCIQVGKDTVKGNGFFRIEPTQPALPKPVQPAEPVESP